MHKEKMMSKKNEAVSEANSDPRYWEVFDGDVRLFEDGSVQHISDGNWSDGWGEWARFPQADLRPRDASAIRKWKRAVEASQLLTTSTS
jgi:hypothetical protein